MVRVQSDGWFADTFCTEIEAVSAELASEQSFADLFHLPLAVLKKSFPVFLREEDILMKKLLLRESPGSETPKLQKVTSVHAEFDLPKDFEFNERAKKTGVFMLDQQSMEIVSQNQKLFIHGVMGTEKFRLQLDFVMSHPMYGEQATRAMSTFVVEPLVLEHERMFKEMLPFVMNLLESGKEENAVMRFLDSKIALPILLK